MAATAAKSFEYEVEVEDVESGFLSVQVAIGSPKQQVVTNDVGALGQ